MTHGDLVREAVRKLLQERAPEATVCPSEVAKAVANGLGEGTPRRPWRDEMPSIHEVVDRLLADGQVQLSWKGRLLSTRSGPYRIRRGTTFDGLD